MADTVTTADRVLLGRLETLERAGVLTGKLGSVPVCVFLDGEVARAVEDRCPHMGFPLHRGSVEGGLLTCHWHHARFDLCSGGTLDPFADDVAAFDVEVVDGDVFVLAPNESDPTAALQARLREGLEQGLTLVLAKAVIALLDRGVEAREIIDAGVDFGVRYRVEGWGSGLTVLVAMANVLPVLDPVDRPLALVQGLKFLADDTAGRAPRFALAPLEGELPIARLSSWYRRFVDTRSVDAAERTLASTIASGHHEPEVATMMAGAVTDHVFIDEGHTVDFTNKAFESLAHLGWPRAAAVLATLVRGTALARRHEEESSWRHPIDLTVLLAQALARLPETLAAADTSPFGDGEVANLGESLLTEDPIEVLGVLDDALARGATGEQLARAVAFAAALRILRFHTQNDHGDWNEVHHAFTAANALHASMVRSPSAAVLRGVYQCALRIYLDRFLNVPAARHPGHDSGVDALDGLDRCFDVEGEVDQAGRIVYGYLDAGGDPVVVVARLGHALLVEDAGFHWFQLYEAAVRQFVAWPAASEPGALILTAFARFLAAHTPTRRELSGVVRIAERLGRGEPLYAETEG